MAEHENNLGLGDYLRVIKIAGREFELLGFVAKGWKLPGGHINIEQAGRFGVWFIVGFADRKRYLWTRRGEWVGERRTDGKHDPDAFIQTCEVEYEVGRAFDQPPSTPKPVDNPSEAWDGLLDNI